eukprot:GGOE01036682.1.p1 GENE.GGOE01036682.1~~GGOE01036682.1.p1  ORF type:complete len:679 (-),score=199.82 GGOE01036682.1:158-2194(-)
MTEVCAPTIELEHAIGFAGQPNSLYLHPNGRECVYLAGACVVVADLQDAHQQEFVRGHDDNLTCLCLSRSGTWLVSGQQGVNANVCVWRYADRQIIFRLEEHDFGVRCVALTDDEKLLVTVGHPKDGKVVIWDMSIGHIVCHTSTLDFPEPASLAHWGGKVQDVKRRETEVYQYCVLAGTDVFNHLLNPITGQLTVDKLNTSLHVRRGTAAAYNSTGSLLFVGSESGDVGLYSLRERKLVASCTVCSGGLRCLALPKQPVRQDSSQGSGFRYANFGHQDRPEALYCGGGDGSVSLYEVWETGKPVMDERNRLVMDGEVTSISLSQDVTTFALGTTVGTVHLGSLVPGRPGTAHVLLEAPLAAVHCVRYHPLLNDRFVTASADGFVRVWDSSSYRIVSKAGGPNISAQRLPAVGKQNAVKTKGIASAPDSSSRYPVCISYIGQMEICLSAWSDGCIRAFDATNGEFLWNVDNAHRCSITALVIAPNLKFFVTGGAEGEVRLWEMKTREMVTELKEHKGMVTGLRIMADSSHLLSASKDKSVITWDLMKERRACSHEQRMGAISSVDLYHNQTNFVTAGLEKRLSLWDLRQGCPVLSTPYSTMGNGEAYCTVASLSNDNRFLCTGGTDQVVRLWDASQLQPIEVGIGHSGVVNDVQWSPDDKQAVSVGADACVFLWNIYA